MGLFVAPAGRLEGVGDSAYQDFGTAVYDDAGNMLSGGGPSSGDWSLIERGGMLFDVLTDGGGNYTFLTNRLFDSERVVTSRAWWSGMGFGGGVAAVMILLRVARLGRRPLGGL